MISDGALVTITLMIAESRPEEKDIMVNLVFNNVVSSQSLLFYEIGNSGFIWGQHDSCKYR